jgi:hypothetical protein
MSVFLTATREKFRFPSVKGDLSAEQLWDLPLTSRTGADLDTVAKAVNAELRSLSEESFVDSGANAPKRRVLTAKLDLVKEIIATKQKESADAANRRAKVAMRERLAEAIEAKRNAQLDTLSLEELEAQYAQLLQ